MRLQLLMRASAAENFSGLAYKRKEIFWLICLICGIRLRTRPRPHCVSERANVFSFRRVIAFSAGFCFVFKSAVLFAVSGCHQTTGNMLPLHTAGFEPAIDGLTCPAGEWTTPSVMSFQDSSDFHHARDSSGIHFGIALCTAVKDIFKHTLEVTLQAYFTS